MSLPELTCVRCSFSVFSQRLGSSGGDHQGGGWRSSVAALAEHEIRGQSVAGCREQPQAQPRPARLHFLDIVQQRRRRPGGEGSSQVQTSSQPFGPNH